MSPAADPLVIVHQLLLDVAKAVQALAMATGQTDIAHDMIDALDRHAQLLHLEQAFDARGES